MDSHSQLPHKFHQTLTLNDEQSKQNDDNVDNDEDDSASTTTSDFEFSFAGGFSGGSPVSADEIFHNGQIRPTVSFSGESATTSYAPPVRKLFVKSSPERDDIAEKFPAPEIMRKKSNSTGFSKLWRFRDLLVRSHSDGKDAFVFLTENSPEKKDENKKKVKLEKKVGETTSLRESKKKGGETASLREKKKEKSVYEVLYGKRDKEKKNGKGKGKTSYLPYKQDLVGFFTNSSGMTRNVHPY